jgi:hypothetical protein
LKKYIYNINKSTLTNSKTQRINNLTLLFSYFCFENIVDKDTNNPDKNNNKKRLLVPVFYDIGKFLWK